MFENGKNCLDEMRFRMWEIVKEKLVNRKVEQPYDVEESEG